MGLRLAVVADDLTGALDSSEPFARAGLSVSVATSVAALRSLPRALPQVVAVNTESRALSREAAAAAVSAAWALLGPLSPTVLFKKIDSRMKGHVQAEVCALWDGSGRAHVVVAPAIPAMGRLVRGGMVKGFGVDAAIRIPALPDWHVPDCTDLVAMRAVAETILAGGTGLLAVGASGLAEALALAMAGPQIEPVAVPAPQSVRERRMIMAIGSRDPITLEQLSVLARTELPGERPIVLLPPSGQMNPAEVAAELAQRALVQARESGVATILLSGGDTAAAFIREAGLEVLRPAGALEPGMPVARGEAAGTTFTLITKSGGFGVPDALVNAWRSWAG